jgi:hypothetical protein
MAHEHLPFRERVANRVFDALRAAAKKVGISEHTADRFVLKSILFSAGKKRVGKYHAPGARRLARRRQQASRAEQRAKGIYRRPQA